jgi:hypothetical protein
MPRAFAVPSRFRPGLLQLLLCNKPVGQTTVIGTCLQAPAKNLC